MSEIRTVPEKTDVCVAGAGSAALCTAIAAKEAGADVLMLEKAPKELAGGDLRYCGGFRVTSAVYSEKKFYDDIMAVTKGRADPELTRIMVKESAPMIEWLTGFGVKWNIRLGAGISHVALGAGYGLFVHLLSVAEKMNIKILYETKAADLLTDDFGEVVGVKAKKRGDRLRDIQCGAVVLACGGYSANPEMMSKYFDRYAGTMHVRGSRYNTGEGIVMAEKAGAMLDFMGDFHGVPEHRDTPRFGAGGCNLQPYRMGVWVNLNGKRFTDEGDDYEDKTYVRIGKDIYFQPGNIALLVFDETIRNKSFRDPNDTVAGLLKRPLEGANLPPDLVRRAEIRKTLSEKYYKADTIEDLAKAAGISPTTLKQTIDEYNAAIKDKGGADGTPCAPTLSPPKSGWAYPIMKPPFYAYPSKCGITLTFGGPVVNAKSEVIDKEGNVIPGLYAAGAMTAGFFYYNYAAGAAMTRNGVFGRIAGRNAAEYAEKAKHQS